MNWMAYKQIKSNEPLLNIEEPAPLVLAVILVLAHIGFLIAPNALKDSIWLATSLQSNAGNVFLDGRPFGTLATLLTHTLKHQDWAHVLMNSAFIFIFGMLTIRAAKNRSIPLIGRVKRGPAVFLTIFLVGAVLGGLMQWLVWSLTGATSSAVGASTGGSALFAAAGWALGGKERMFGFIFVLMAIDLVSIATGASNPAWAGHFGGFVAGALLSPRLLNPGGANFSMFR